MSCCITSGIVSGIVALLIFIMVLIIVSFKKLDTNEMGILFNSASRHFDRTKVYEAGRHYVNVGNSFIIYPKTSEPLDIYGINARSSDGLKVVIDISFNYRITADIDVLLRIYERYGKTKEEYVAVLTKMASNIIRDAASEFEAFSFFNDRASVTSKMSSGLENDIGPLGFVIEGFQLLNYDMPASFQDAIEETQAQQQEIDRVTYQEEGATLTASTRVNEAIQQCESIVISAQGTASATYSERTAAADALTVALEKEAGSYQKLKEELGLTGEELVSWLWVNAISSSAAQKSQVVTQPENVIFS